MCTWRRDRTISARNEVLVERLAVIRLLATTTHLVHVSHQTASVDASADQTSTSVLMLVGHRLHVRRDQTVRAQQMPFETLIGEESPLALLTIQRRPAREHFLVYPHLFGGRTN